MSKIKNVSVHLKLDPVKKILTKRGLQDKGPAQIQCALILKNMCDPYVPVRVGVLKNTAMVEPDGVLYGAKSKNKDGVEYGQSYAAVQYYTNKGNGMRGKYWDKRMMADKGDEYTRKVAKAIGGEAK